MKHTRLKLIVLLPLLVGCHFSSHLEARQSSTPPPKPRNDRQQEDAVAKLFDQVRKNAKLHRLSRIEERTSLQQLVCTVALTDKVPLFHSGFPVLGNDSINGGTNEKQAANTAAKVDVSSTLYKTTNPGEITPELQRLALFERPRGSHGHSPGYARYSVAVWPVQRSTNDKAEYWVSAELFWSSGNEFFLNHFSDAMEWKNEWKTFVTPECRDVR
jgi:hypothetical protein